MGNACTNCSQCKGDDGESNEMLTVDHKVSFFGLIYSHNQLMLKFCGFSSKFLFYAISLTFVFSMEKLCLQRSSPITSGTCTMSFGCKRGREASSHVSGSGRNSLR